MTKAVRLACVGVGSNHNPALRIPEALARLRALYGPLAESVIYESAPLHGAPGPSYRNLVVSFQTVLAWAELKQALREIEDSCGRQRPMAPGGAVALDLDLLLLIGATGSVEHDLPLERLRRESFVLKPLAELMPDWRHPETECSLTELWQRVAAEAVALVPVST